MNVTLHGNVAEIVDRQMKLGGYESPEDLVYEALQALMSQKIEQGIDEGLKDVEEGRVVEINKENLDSVLSQPVSQWQ